MLTGLIGQLSSCGFRGNPFTDTRTYLNKFLSFRTRCARIVGLPAEVLKCLDYAIAILKNQQRVAKCGFDVAEPRGKQAFV